jgi:hypothetical protein
MWVVWWVVWVVCDEGCLGMVMLGVRRDGREGKGEKIEGILFEGRI